ncbi:MAG: hypothetical protein HLUCCA12_13205 [Rhodobacteraceae bacterium HLUCCA12]|nr:MAG: hypothetical protein HLUCCA12_13205 [Rhodobacteraceae bacterium HLUCCA12]
MTDRPDDKTPEAIKKHKVQQNFDMKGPLGSAVRQQETEKLVAKDQERFGGDRAAKYAKMEKAAIISKEDVRNQNKGKLIPEMEKASGREKER